MVPIPFIALLLFVPFIHQILLVSAQSLRNIHLGFPEAWDGDKFPEIYCPSKNIPKWLDGYFLCQLSAAYGDPNAPPGQKLMHMIDAIGAVGSFHLSGGEVVFSARYYPSRPYRIWEFYDRNMTKASVPWAGWSHYNLSAMARWEQVPANPDAARFHPNLDFWRIGHRIIAGTEAPYWVGYEFDVPKLSNFRLASFVEDNDIFGTSARPSLIPISMAMHERADTARNAKNGDEILWGTFSAMNFDEERFFQGLFTIDSNGVRKVVGMYDYGTWDAKACSKEDEYIGDKSHLPGYMHSISSTEHYVILPITSLVINPCKFKEPPRTAGADPQIQQGGLWGMDFYDVVPMRFLVFDKRTNSWLTQKPLEVFPSMFVTHQLNAFEDSEGNIVADMIVYDSHDPYVKYFYADFLRSQLYPNTARILRFTLDLRTFRVMYSYLIPQETISADFPQINRAFDSRPYQWAYFVENPFAGGNKIVKINVNEPSGAKNLHFTPDELQLVLHEPYFEQRPGATREDDGILLVRGLELEENKGVLLVIDATSMEEIGRAFVPISVPFGFHNRFFSRQQLGLTSGKGVVEEEEEEKPKNGNQKNKMSARTMHHRRTFWERMVKSNGTSTPMPPIGAAAVSWRPIQPTEAEEKKRKREEEEEAEDSGEEQQRPATNRRPPLGPYGTRHVPLPPEPTALPWWPTRPVRLTHPPFFRTSAAPPTATEVPPYNTVPGPPVSPPTVAQPFPFAPPPQSSEFFPEAKLSIARPLHIRRASKPMTVRQLYERTLRALCRWASKVFSSISYQGCVHSGQRAIRWLSPAAQRIVQQHAPPLDDPELLELVEVDQQWRQQQQQRHDQGQQSATAENAKLRPVFVPPADETRRKPWYLEAETERKRTEPADWEGEEEEQRRTQ
ncbi:hypothetical protein niasHT_030753 [Heterodera trifolii]|uniref:Uncharacterized protein n=1 Tax=Heterodera trifolii TaxID=157864 RepID=A0ABD2HSY9_9BILA